MRGSRDGSSAESEATIRNPGVDVFSGSGGGFAASPGVGADPFGLASFEDQFGAIEVDGDEGPKRIAVGGDVGKVTELFVDTGRESFATGGGIVEPPVGGTVDLEVTHAVDLAFVVHVEMAAEDGCDGAWALLFGLFDDATDFGTIF